MPTFTTVDAAWTPSPTTFDDAEARRFDTAMFLGDGTANGVRGGVVRHGDTSLAVTVNGSDQVTVQPGAFVIPAATGLGVYRGALSAAVGPAAGTALSTRNATNPRIDLVVIQATSTGAVVKTIDGTPGSSPSVPALPAQHIEVARLNVPQVGGGAVTVDSTFRAYATALGGTLYVHTAARLPGSGNITGQRAVALDTGSVSTWQGAAWFTVPADSAFTSLTPWNGWTGSLTYGRVGGVATVDIQVSKASWAANDSIFATPPIPAGWRPRASTPFFGSNATGDGSARPWTINPSTGEVLAASAGTGSIWGTATFMLP